MATNFSTWYKYKAAPNCPNYGASSVHTLVLTLVKAQLFYFGTTQCLSAMGLTNKVTRLARKQLPAFEFDLELHVKINKRLTGICCYEATIAIDQVEYGSVVVVNAELTQRKTKSKITAQGLTEFNYLKPTNGETVHACFNL